MARVLIVDDSPTQAQLALSLLEDAGFDVRTAGSGEEALGLLKKEEPDLILTDLEMPGMSGLELVEAVHAEHSAMPVILMTLFGSEDTALEALRRGAASYVPKRRLARDLADTASRVLAMAQATREQQRLFECLTHVEQHFVLDNDPGLVPPLVSHLSECVSKRNFCGASGLLHLTVAWSEALLNAMQHGNLEVSSDLRQQDERIFQTVLARRRREEPYASRRVHVTASLSPEELVCVVRDEGPGFDPSSLPDPRDPANLEKVGGRGLLLIRTFMDEVRHNASGNEITLVKRRGASAGEREARRGGPGA